MVKLTRPQAFAALELNEEASESEIRVAYKRLALKWHPDKNSLEDRDECTARIQVINAAYTRLTKHDYDDDELDDDDEEDLYEDDLFAEIFGARGGPRGFGFRFPPEMLAAMFGGFSFGVPGGGYMFPGSYYYDDYETPQQEQDKARAEEERRKNKVLEEQQKARLTAGTPTVVLEAAQQTVLQLGVKVPVAATPMGKQVYGMPQGVVAEVAVRRVGGADGSKQQGGGGGGAGGKKKGGKKGGQQGGGAAGGWRSVPCDVIQAYMGRVNRSEDVVARAWVEGLEAGCKYEVKARLGLSGKFSWSGDPDWKAYGAVLPCETRAPDPLPQAQQPKSVKAGSGASKQQQQTHAKPGGNAAQQSKVVWADEVEPSEEAEDEEEGDEEDDEEAMEVLMRAAAAAAKRGNGGGTGTGKKAATGAPAAAGNGGSSGKRPASGDSAAAATPPPVPSYQEAPPPPPPPPPPPRPRPKIVPATVPVAEPAPVPVRVQSPQEEQLQAPYGTAAGAEEAGYHVDAQEEQEQDASPDGGRAARGDGRRGRNSNPCPRKLKTVDCRHWMSGGCPRGDDCWFIHDPVKLGMSKPAAAPAPNPPAPPPPWTDNYTRPTVVPAPAPARGPSPVHGGAHRGGYGYGHGYGGRGRGQVPYGQVPYSQGPVLLSNRDLLKDLLPP